MSNSTPLYFFDNFDLRFEVGTTPGTYRARVQSPAGEATGADFSVPAEWRDTERLFQADDPTTLESIGKALFEWVFRGDVKTAFDKSTEITKQKGKSLRIRLRFQDAPALADLPWELLTPPHQNPLTLSIHTPLVRYLDLLDTPKPLSVSLPLRVLVVIATPASQPFVDGDAEWEALTSAVRPLQQEGLVVLEHLQNATFTKLQEALRRATPYHILHYIGHSRFNPDSRHGELLLESDDPEKLENPLGAKDFAQLLADHRTTHQNDPSSLRLVYLNSCQGASDIAESLVKQSLPAVIAMQGNIPSRAAVTLASHFYTALAKGNPVDVALTTARQNFRQATQQSSWALPVLFLRSDNSYLFALPGQRLPDMAGTTLPPAPGESPYQGLAYYDLHDHPRFFGRETLTGELVDYLRSNQSLVVVGASGSGKSSLVRAGVVPALLGMSKGVEQERLSRNPNNWQTYLFTPTAHPLKTLAAAVTSTAEEAAQLEASMGNAPNALDFYLRRRLAGDSTTRILLVIDQLEELFTLDHVQNNKI